MIAPRAHVEEHLGRRKPDGARLAEAHEPLSPDLARALHEAGWDSDHATSPGHPARLASLLDGFAKLGAPGLIAIAPGPLGELASWLESHAARQPGDARFSIVAMDQPGAPESQGPDVWFAAFQLGEGEPEPRVRRLIAAGVPVIRFVLPSLDALEEEKRRWELALRLAALGTSTRVPREVSMQARSAAGSGASEAAGRTDATTRSATGTAHDADRAHPALAVPRELVEPRLHADSLALHALDSHAYILRKVAGTLGKAAESSPAHWLAAQIALGDSGDLLSFHWLGAATAETRAALHELHAALRGPNKLAARISFAPPEFDGASPLAGASSRGLFFLLDGAESSIPNATSSVPDAANSIPDAVNSVQDAVNSVQDAVNSVQDAANSIPDAVNSVQDAVNSIPDAANSVQDAANAAPNIASSTSIEAIATTSAATSSSSAHTSDTRRADTSADAGLASLAQLAAAGRRAILLRSEDGDATHLLSALRKAVELLTP